MEALEILLNRRWILKSEDKNLYYQIRDAAGDLRPFLTEKLGCHLIENSTLVKLEKIPAQPESFMGIEEFHSIDEYVFFCILLMFLEDRDAEEQFILSQLTEYISTSSPEAPVDWTLYSNRRKLVRVLRFAVAQGILRISDGSDEGFMNEYEGEVLYENTGASRYFMRNFSSDIMNYQKPEDFSDRGWYEMDEDRGLIRRHRVYNRILFSPGMYRESGSAEDFEYLKYYHRRLREDLERNFDCQIQIFKGSVFFIPGEDCRIGHTFPENNTLSDAVMLACGLIRERIGQGDWQVRADETVQIEELEWENLLLEVKQRYSRGFSKAFRLMSGKEFVEKVSAEMERWTFIRSDREQHRKVILPSAGRITAHYPDEFTGEEDPSEAGEHPVKKRRNGNRSSSLSGIKSSGVQQKEEQQAEKAQEKKQKAEKQEEEMQISFFETQEYSS